jgi:hypothetical protein
VWCQFQAEKVKIFHSYPIIGKAGSGRVQMRISATRRDLQMRPFPVEFSGARSPTYLIESGRVSSASTHPHRAKVPTRALQVTGIQQANAGSFAPKGLAINVRVVRGRSRRRLPWVRRYNLRIRPVKSHCMARNREFLMNTGKRNGDDGENSEAGRSKDLVFTRPRFLGNHSASPDGFAVGTRKSGTANH